MDDSSPETGTTSLELAKTSYLIIVPRVTDLLSRQFIPVAQFHPHIIMSSISLCHFYLSTYIYITSRQIVSKLIGLIQFTAAKPSLLMILLISAPANCSPSSPIFFFHFPENAYLFLTFKNHHKSLTHFNKKKRAFN